MATNEKTVGPEIINNVAALESKVKAIHEAQKVYAT